MGMDEDDENDDDDDDDDDLPSPALQSSSEPR